MNAYVKKRVTMKDKRETFRRVVLGTSFRYFLSALLMVSGGLYIWQINTVSAKGYVISDFEKKVSSLERETQSLDVQLAELTSMKNIRERLEEGQFETVTNAEYIGISDHAVAKR